MGRSKESGSSLIEVMVSLFVLAIGLLGVLALQTRSVQYNQSAYSYSQAVYLASDLAERIRANAARAAAPAASAYAVDIPATEPTKCNEMEGATCDAAAMAQHDLWNWSSNVQERLPGGVGRVEPFIGVDNRKYLHIVVTFDDSRSEVSGEQANQSYSLTMEI